MDINNETHPMTNRESFWQAITLACQDLKDQAPQATAHIIHREYMQQDHREQSQNDQTYCLITMQIQAEGHQHSWEQCWVHSEGQRIGRTTQRMYELEEDHTHVYAMAIHKAEHHSHTIETGTHIQLIKDTTEYERVLKTIRTSSEFRRHKVYDYLTSELALFPRLPLNIALSQSHKAHLNPEQHNAIRFALSNAPITHIEGPPGTGKTTVIVEIIKHAVDANKKVLCISPSHLAVDGIISKLKSHSLKYLPIRVGHSTKIQHQDLTEDYRKATLKQEIQDKLEATLISTPPIFHDDPLMQQLTSSKTIEAILSLFDQKHSLKEYSDTDWMMICDRALKILVASEQQEFYRKTSLTRIEACMYQIYLNLDFFRKKLSLARCSKQLDEIAVDQLVHMIDQDSYAPVFGTTVGFMTSRRHQNFDVVIIDEASKMTLTQFLLCSLRADKIIMVGDNHQLPPIIHDREKQAFIHHGICEELVSHSIFYTYAHKLLGIYRHHLLKQYRMHREIVWFSNYKFYHGRLLTGCLDSFNYLHKNRRLIWKDIDGQESMDLHKNSYVNEEEMYSVVNELKTIDDKLTQRMSRKTVGILSFYKSQVKKLKDKVESLDLASLDVEVGTVDSFQGKEKEIIIISFVRTQKFGFINNPERLNVALTRAKDYLYFIGKLSLFSRSSFILSDLILSNKLTIEKEY